MDSPFLPLLPSFYLDLTPTPNHAPSYLLLFYSSLSLPLPILAPNPPFFGPLLGILTLQREWGEEAFLSPFVSSHKRRNKSRDAATTE